VIERIEIRNGGRLMAVARRFAALILAVCLLAPFVDAFTWVSPPEDCSCCPAGKHWCHRTKGAHRGGPGISGNSTCRDGCGQAPGVFGGTPPFSVPVSPAGQFTVSSGELPGNHVALFHIGPGNVALFQRPPPSLV